MVPHNRDILNGKKDKYRIKSQLPSSGKNACLYKVYPVSNPEKIYLAKFFKTPNISEYYKNDSGLETEDHLAFDLGTEEQRAFKRFKKEPRFLKLFSHPNIVRYIDEYSDMKTGNSNKCFYIQEYLSGKSLGDYIQDNYIPGNPIEISIGIAAALVELHSKNVIHRDIHPGNIFLSNSTPKLIDFGCAVGGGITRPFNYEGEPSGLAGQFHRAPEAINPPAAIPASDIFSFGITLIELFNTEKPSEIDRENRNSWIRYNLNKLSGTQPQIKDLIEQMVLYDSTKRPCGNKVYYQLISTNKSSNERASCSAPEYPNQGRRLPWGKIIGGSGILVGLAVLIDYLNNKPKKGEKEPISSEVKPSSKEKIRAVFLDIDNTLAYKTKENNQYITLPPGDKYLSPKTIENLKTIEKKVPIILVTGRRATNYEFIKRLIPHKYAVFESGAIIFEQSKYFPINWQGNDTEKLKKLWEYEIILNNQNIKTNKDGRQASFRIIKEENLELKESNLNVPNGIKLVDNSPFWDFVLKEAGKENAAQFLLKQLGYSLDDGLFVGEGINDLELLKLIHYPITFANANERVVNAVKKREGYITKKISHEGINDILEYVQEKLRIME